MWGFVLCVRGGGFDRGVEAPGCQGLLIEELLPLMGGLQQRFYSGLNLLIKVQ